MPAASRACTAAVRLLQAAVAAAPDSGKGLVVDETGAADGWLPLPLLRFAYQTRVTKRAAAAIATTQTMRYLAGGVGTSLASGGLGSSPSGGTYIGQHP